MSYDKSAEDKVQSEAHNSSSLFQVGTEETLHEIVLTNPIFVFITKKIKRFRWCVATGAKMFPGRLP